MLFTSSAFLLEIVRLLSFIHTCCHAILSQIINNYILFIFSRNFLEKSCNIGQCMHLFNLRTWSHQWHLCPTVLSRTSCEGFKCSNLVSFYATCPTLLILELLYNTAFKGSQSHIYLSFLKLRKHKARELALFHATYCDREESTGNIRIFKVVLAQLKWTKPRRKYMSVNQLWYVQDNTQIDACWLQ